MFRVWSRFTSIVNYLFHVTNIGTHKLVTRQTFLWLAYIHSLSGLSILTVVEIVGSIVFLFYSELSQPFLIVVSTHEGLICYFQEQLIIDVVAFFHCHRNNHQMQFVLFTCSENVAQCLLILYYSWSKWVTVPHSHSSIENSYTCK